MLSRRTKTIIEGADVDNADLHRKLEIPIIIEQPTDSRNNWQDIGTSLNSFDLFTAQDKLAKCGVLTLMKH